VKISSQFQLKALTNPLKKLSLRQSQGEPDSGWLSMRYESVLSFFGENGGSVPVYFSNPD